MIAADDLRDACVAAAALCEMILRQGLWPDIDLQSLAEYRASVEAVRDRCLEAVRQFDQHAQESP